MPSTALSRPHRTNLTRQRQIAALMARHSRLSTPQGTHIGCLCADVKASRSRYEYYLHVAEIVDLLIQEALDATFGEASR